MLRQARHASDSDGPPIRDATTTDESVVLDLAWGRCTVTADDDALVLLAEAETHEDLAKIQAGVGQRVTKIGRRDGLGVTWSPAEGDSGAEGATVPASSRRSGVITALILIAVVAVIGIHLGIGVALLRRQWTWWLLGAVAALVILKLSMARHLVSSIRAHRSHRPWRH